MKLSCDAAELAAALAVVSRALAARTTLPVLGMVRLEANYDRLLLEATNLELGIRKPVRAEIAEGGAIAVPGRLLTEFTSAIGEERLDLELHTPGFRLLLRTASYETEIQGIDPEEFPPAPTADGGEQVTLPADRLVDAIADTLAAASTDEARPVLTGVRLSAANHRLTLTATDGYRLAERTVAADRGGKLRATVPARTMVEVARLFRSAQGDVEVILAQQGNQVFFRGSEGEVSSRVIDGGYPNTGRLIPSAWTTRASVDAAELNRRLRALFPFAQQSANVVRLTVGSGAVGLSAAATDVGSARTQLDADVSGPEMAFAFNARYLLDCLGSAEDQIDLELQGPLAPAVVRRPATGDYVYLFMPVRYPL
ncbi:MAG TPA: DNA polymerase III subunit beta [Candidatus Dormibacteraeota bacterium]|nr:DNA polymerase III subunit beta [Candidatus Dormibacteraeota bacterium]